VPNKPTPTSPRGPKPPEQDPTTPPKHQHPGEPGPTRHHHEADPPPPLATGVLSQCDTGWCVDTLPIDFGTADLTARLVDLDGDGKTRSLTRELRALARLETTVTVVLDPAAEPATPTNGEQVPASPLPAATDPASDGTGDSASSSGPSASATEAPADELDPIIVTVDTDGLVISIDAVAVPQV